MWINIGIMLSPADYHVLKAKALRQEFTALIGVNGVLVTNIGTTVTLTTTEHEALFRLALATRKGAVT